MSTDTTAPGAPQARDLTRFTAAQLSDVLGSSLVSAVEVAGAHLDRIGEVDDRVHAFLHVAAERRAGRGRWIEPPAPRGSHSVRWPASRWP